MRETKRYGYDTELTVERPWGWYLSGRAFCPDGKVRALARISTTADSFYSVPAAVKVAGRTVSGFVSIEDTVYDRPDVDDQVVIFTPNESGRNAGLLPVW